MSRYVDEHRGHFGVEPICKTLGVSVSAYYQRRSGQPLGRAVEDERLLGRIRELHAANYYAYGYRRMWKALRRAGEQVPRGQVQRLMQRNGHPGREAARQAVADDKPDPAAQRRPDLVQRDFSATRPNELWVADLSYLRCWEGLVFFAFVLDAYSADDRRLAARRAYAHDLGRDHEARTPPSGDRPGQPSQALLLTLLST